MKQKIIIWLSLILFLVVVAFMVKDFFYQPELNSENPYEYKMDKLRHVDSTLIEYVKLKQIKPNIEILHAITIDKSDDVFITGKDRILKFDKDLNLISTFVTGKEATCIAIAEDNKIYLGIHDHIEVYEKDGKLIKSWSPVNEKSEITSIAVHVKFVYAADAGNRVVYQYNSEGKILREIGKKNVEKGILGFIIPSPYFDLLIGREDELWVVNPGRHTLESYNEQGDQISSWKRTSMDVDGFSGCCNPSNIAMLSDGSFVTSEKGIERVKVHQPSGEFKCVVASPDDFIEGTKGLDLSVDSKDRVYVLDPLKKEVSIYVKK